MSSRFFTNNETNTLLKKFEGIFEHNPDLARFDALVGYLRASGYFAIRPNLGSACNIVSVKVQSTSKPALRPMERSGIGLSAGRRPLQEPETGLVGARPQLDNGGVKI